MRQALKQHKKAMAASEAGNVESPYAQQEFDSLLVLDFEATCIKDGKIEPQVEIILGANVNSNQR